MGRAGGFFFFGGGGTGMNVVVKTKILYITRVFNNYIERVFN